MGVLNTIRDRGIDYDSFGFGTILAVFCVIAYRRNKDFGLQMWVLRVCRGKDHDLIDSMGNDFW